MQSKKNFGDALDKYANKDYHRLFTVGYKESTPGYND